MPPRCLNTQAKASHNQHCIRLSITPYMPSSTASLHRLPLMALYFVTAQIICIYFSCHSQLKYNAISGPKLSITNFPPQQWPYISAAQLKAKQYLSITALFSPLYHLATSIYISTILSPPIQISMPLSPVNLFKIYYNLHLLIYYTTPQTSILQHSVNVINF